MTGRGRLAAAVTVMVLICGCSHEVPGTATWPGAALQRALLRSADFPDGVRYDRVDQDRHKPDGAGDPVSMMTRPEGCANGLTKLIGRSAERGPGSAAQYEVRYDGARIMMTLLSWNLDLAAIEAEAKRCAKFDVYFDANSMGIPMITSALDGMTDGALGYRQTMTLGGTGISTLFAFENVGGRAVFGLAGSVSDSKIPVKASLPQTFLDVFVKQGARLRAS